MKLIQDQFYIRSSEYIISDIVMSNQISSLIALCWTIYNETHFHWNNNFECSGYNQWAINWRKPNAQNSKIDCRCSSFEEMDPTTEDTPSGNVKQRSIKKNSHVWSSWRQMAKLKDLRTTSEEFRRFQKNSSSYKMNTFNSIQPIRSSVTVSMFKCLLFKNSLCSTKH